MHSDWSAALERSHMVEKTIKGQGYKSRGPNMEGSDRGRSGSGGLDNGEILAGES